MSALASTATSYPQTHDKIPKPQDTPYFLDNEFRTSQAEKFIDLFDPATPAELGARWQAALAAMVADPDALLDELLPGPAAEPAPAERLGIALANALHPQFVPGIDSFDKGAVSFR